MTKTYQDNKDKFIRLIEQREKDMNLLIDQEKLDKQ
jgi:hypothetical protein